MDEIERVIPLPHEVAIIQRSIVALADVRLVSAGCPSGADAVQAGTVEHALEQLATLFPAECRYATDLPASGMRLVVGLVDPQTGQWCQPPPGCAPAPEAARRLRSLPNSEQAYTIQPAGARELHVAALDGPGLYYGAQTLVQMFQPAFARSVGGSLDLPLPCVVDWPDAQERGVWNNDDVPQWVEWMSVMKLNYANQGSTPANFQRGVRVTQTMEEDVMHTACLRGFRFVPQIVHLNFLDGWGLFQAYPELAGIGDDALAGRYFAHKTGAQHRAPDASNPKLVEILAEWMEEIAAHFTPGQLCQDICCWLTERPAEDGRPSTAEGGGQFVLEARAFIAAWEQARLQYPALQIRLFLSTTSPQNDDQIVAEAPEGVKIVRCCFTDAERVTNQPRDLFPSAVLQTAAAGGRWVGTYDVPLSCNGRVETPMFKLPHRSAHRIRDFVRQKVHAGYASIAGMMGWSYAADRICGFHLGALAEWSWNANGRSPDEFANAWGLRSGLAAADVTAFVQWHGLLGPVEWDVYDSQFPTAWNCPYYEDGPFEEPQPGLRTFVKEQLMPHLGRPGPFRYFCDAQAFADKSAACATAAALVAPGTTLYAADPSLALEAEVIASYVQLLGAIYAVLHQRSTETAEHAVSAAGYASMGPKIEAMERAGARNVEAIRAWRRAIGDAGLGTQASSPVLQLSWGGASEPATAASSVSTAVVGGGGGLEQQGPHRGPAEPLLPSKIPIGGGGSSSSSSSAPSSQAPPDPDDAEEAAWHVRVRDAMTASAETVAEIASFVRDYLGLQTAAGGGNLWTAGGTQIHDESQKLSTENPFGAVGHTDIDPNVLRRVARL